jgi:hypothetical protein
VAGWSSSAAVRPVKCTSPANARISGPAGATGPGVGAPAAEPGDDGEEDDGAEDDGTEDDGEEDAAGWNVTFVQPETATTNAAAPTNPAAAPESRTEPG